MSKIYRCADCGYEKTFWSGIGMLYPKVYEEEIAKAKAGGYGQELAALIEQYPEGELDISYKTYVCPKCGSFRHMKKLDYYETGGYGFRRDPEDEGPVPAIHEVRRVPKCRTCGVDRIEMDVECGEENIILKCPKCGGEFGYFSEIFID